MSRAIQPPPAQPPRRAPGPRGRYPGELFFRLDTGRFCLRGRAHLRRKLILGDGPSGS